MIVDSGNRTEFETGAVRDIQEGKGRCDLLPLDIVAPLLEKAGPALYAVHEFQKDGEPQHLHDAIHLFKRFAGYKGIADLMLEVAVHFEEGAKKYGDRNWEKGIPVKRYIDSGVRHYLKYLRGDTDERHDRAFVWNMLCAMWTCVHHPSLNEYRKKESENG